MYRTLEVERLEQWNRIFLDVLIRVSTVYENNVEVAVEVAANYADAAVRVLHELDLTPNS